MRLSRQIKRYCKPFSYKKASRRNLEAISNKLDISDSTATINIYSKRFDLDRRNYRIVSTQRYRGHLAYKVYNKNRCLYELYSPFYRQFVTI